MSGGTLMLTVVLRHDQSRNLEQLQGRLDDADWWHGFPPEGCEVVWAGGLYLAGDAGIRVEMRPARPSAYLDWFGKSRG